MPVNRANFNSKEEVMKKLLNFLAIFSAALACCFVAACGDRQPVTADEYTVIITASDTAFDFDGKTLKDYMDYLQDNQKLTYSINNGMVTAINGKSNTTSSFWMLYTSDEQNSNDAWGTFEYEGEIYGSATLGAESLPVKEGCVYVWAYQSF